MNDKRIEPKGYMNGPKPTGKWVVKHLGNLPGPKDVHSDYYDGDKVFELFICRKDDKWATDSYGWFGPSKKRIADSNTWEGDYPFFKFLKKAAQQYTEELNVNEEAKRFSRSAKRV